MGEDKTTFKITMVGTHLSNNDNIVMNRFNSRPFILFRWLGFSYSFNATVLSDPTQVKRAWEYDIQLRSKVLNWLDFKLFIIKRYERV
jgi:hypothetical protein